MLSTQIPEFIYEKSGWGTLHAYDLLPDLRFFLCIYPDRNGDSFSVEIGWSATRNCLAARMVWLRERLDMHAADTRIRVDVLWGEMDPPYVFGIGQQPRTSWKPGVPAHPEEELLPEAKDKARFAVNRIIEYALPVFREVARVRGHEVHFVVRRGDEDRN